jgi:septum formation protein
MYLVLASKSPRRKELLLQAGYKLQIRASDVDEEVAETEPKEKVLAIAKKKASMFLIK